MPQYVGSIAVEAERRAAESWGIMDRIFYSVPEVASALGVGRSTVYELMNSGELKSAKIRDRRVIPAESVTAFAQSVLKAA
jgi:excisionase family DNA binding protein